MPHSDMVVTRGICQFPHSFINLLLRPQASFGGKSFFNFVFQQIWICNEEQAAMSNDVAPHAAVSSAKSATWLFPVDLLRWRKTFSLSAVDVLKILIGEKEKLYTKNQNSLNKRSFKGKLTSSYFRLINIHLISDFYWWLFSNRSNDLCGLFVRDP